jgi:hypothetical protein
LQKGGEGSKAEAENPIVKGLRNIKKGQVKEFLLFFVLLLINH